MSKPYRIVRDEGNREGAEYDPFPKHRFASEVEADQFCEYLVVEKGEDRANLFVMHEDDPSMPDAFKDRNRHLERRFAVSFEGNLIDINGNTVLEADEE